MITYKTRGTCSRAINIDIDGDIIKSVEFVGGCRGNAQGVSLLVEGMLINDVIAKLKGIECRGGTSCPDQLAIALEQLLIK